MRYTVGIGRYFGIPVKIHFTFPLILIVLGAQAWVEGSARDAIVTVLFVLAAFFCVVLHEFGHSIQVRRYGIVVRDIILLPIGGMARAEKIPDNPWQEIIVAISGPIVNFAIAAVLYAVTVLRGVSLWSDGDFIVNLMVINIALGLFNLIPAFPMDGGRILRGLLALRFPYLRATRYAKAVGQFIALVFVVVGFTSSWFMLPVIAVFIFFGASHEEEMLRVRSILGEKRLRDLVAFGEPRVAINESVGAASARLHAGGHRVAGVVDDFGSWVGIVTVEDMDREVARRGAEVPVNTVTIVDAPTLSAEMPAMQAYYFLKAEKMPVAAVVDGGSYLGAVETAALLSDSS